MKKNLLLLSLGLLAFFCHVTQSQAQNSVLPTFEVKCYNHTGDEITKKTKQRKGTCYNLGKLSFADAVENYAENTIVFKRGKIGKAPRGDQKDALGRPDAKFVSLGRQGYIVLRFKDNVLIDKPGDDLQIFTDGRKPEPAAILISTDGKKFYPVGQTKTNRSRSDTSFFLTTIDIGAFLPPAIRNNTFSYVKIIDRSSPKKPHHSPTSGVDINAVGAIHSNIALRGFCHFLPNDTKISNICRKHIQQLTVSLKNKKNLHLIIEGHTDNLGTPSENTKLSYQRAKAILKQFLAIAPHFKSLITITGEGESNPLQSNKNKEGKAINRRVDLILSL